SKQLVLSDNILEKVIEEYTSESGVRQLDRTLASLARSVAKNVVTEEGPVGSLSLEEVRKILGPQSHEKEIYQGNEVAGVVTGLAWTPVGGSILFVESTLTPGKG